MFNHDVKSSLDNDRGTSPEIPKFEYSIENPPPLEVLRENIYLTHATNSLPKNDILTAQARDNTRDKKWGESKPPSFRPTLHFSMGELFQGGWEGGFSREEMPYAVLFPLKTAEDQLFSVSPNDTVVVGDFQLDESCTIVLPEGQNYEGRAKVIRYDPDSNNLREAVNRSIGERDGWQMHTDTFIDGPHSFASPTGIEGVEVGSQKFFAQLLDEHPQLSYGSHFHSERGHTWRTGVIDYRIADIIDRYSDTLKNQIPTAELILWRSLIKHNLDVLDNLMSESDYSDAVKSLYGQERKDLVGWLNIVDADVNLRNSQGKTITSVKTEIWEKIRDNRNSPETISNILQQHLSDLNSSRDFRTNIRGFADTVANMPKDEFEAFLSENQASITPEEQEVLELLYATKRWLIIKADQARQEGLENYLISAINKNPAAAKTMFSELKIFLTSKCNRMDTALEILRLKPVLKALSEKWGVKISKLESLSDLIKACPATASLFESREEKITLENVDAHQFLQAIGEGLGEETHTPASYKSFEAAESAAHNKENRQRRKEKLMQEIKTPMNTTRNPDDIEWGETLTFYEMLKRNTKNMEDFWKKLELETEFRKLFSTDEDFWSSGFSMLEIYTQLKKQKD
ncbi:MAG: hypothetical protein PHQ18_02705 [Patescibacteria group bacterium]|nr:hypothetical protein [Patescibacteria group bacterium]